MHFTAREIFLFIILVPLLIVIGRKIRGTSTPEQSAKAKNAELPPEIRKKIEQGYYDEGTMVLLAAFDSQSEAQVVYRLLLERGVYATVDGGIKVHVHAREFAAADALLAEHLRITAGDNPDWERRTCPQCGSDALSYQKYHPSALILLLGAPFLPLKTGRWICLSCGNKWKDKTGDQ